ncbi:MAG: cytochrome C [Arcobacter sp.]|nr:MAG: cytochrome C [Arcobacter sp.]
MKKELFILSVVVAFSLLTYYLVEPFAHSVMHPHVEIDGFKYSGASDIAEVDHKISKIRTDIEAEKAKEKPEDKVLKMLDADMQAAEARREAKKVFWTDVERIAALKGDAVHGESVYANCTSCHMDGAAPMGGVIPPSLRTSGAIYERHYLIGLIKDPAMASNVDHKFSIVNNHQMDSVKYMVSTDQDIVDVIAYMEKIAPSMDEITPKVAFEDACGRCHDVRYMNWTITGTKPTFKDKRDEMAFDIKHLDAQEGIKGYMGKLPPDLSMYIRSRGEHYIKAFVEDPQQLLLGTSMPRVGVNAQTADKVIAYLEEAGDPKAQERNTIGMYVMIYMIFFVIAAYLWKRQVWRDLH